MCPKWSENSKIFQGDLIGLKGHKVGSAVSMECHRGVKRKLLDQTKV